MASHIHGYRDGSVAERLNLPTIRALPVAVPPIEEQHAIANFLCMLDKKIELSRQMNDTLAAMTRTLFKSWFIDFDPVRAKVEGGDPGLPRNLADLFPDSFVDSEKGEIPNGWIVGPIGALAEVMIGGDWGHDTPEDGAVAVRCLRGVDIDLLLRTGWSDAPLRYISQASLEKRLPSSADVLLEGSGECGRSLAFYHVPGVFAEPVIYSNFCKRLRCQSAYVASYIEFVLNDLVVSGEMKNFVTGTAMPNLDHKGLLAGHIAVLPPEQILRCFAKLVSGARSRLYCGESRAVAALLDTLRPELVSGGLRVKSAELLIE